MSGAEYAEGPKGGNGVGVPPMDPYGGPPVKPTGGSEPSAGYTPPVGPKKPTDGPKKGGAYAEAPEPHHEVARARVQDQAPCTLPFQ